MPTMTRHLRGIAIAASAIALTAGVALASPSTPATGVDDAADPGLDRAAEAAGKIVPVRPEPEVPETPEVPEGPEIPDPESDDPADVERPLNHGWYVSEAANGETPDGFDNHGAYVSSIAMGDLGKPDAAAEAADGAAAGLAKATEAKAKAAAAKPNTPAAPTGRP